MKNLSLTAVTVTRKSRRTITVKMVTSTNVVMYGHSNAKPRAVFEFELELEDETARIRNSMKLVRELYVTDLSKDKHKFVEGVTVLNFLNFHFI